MSNKKMRRVWLKDAVQDLRYLYNFYAELSPKFAKEALNTILESSRILEIHPKIAPCELALENLEYEFRSLVVMKGRFKIIYYIEDDKIMISFVADCRQELSNFKKRLES